MTPTAPIQVGGLAVMLSQCVGAGGWGVFFRAKTVPSGDDVGVKLLFARQDGFKAVKNARLIKSEMEHHPAQRYFARALAAGDTNLIQDGTRVQAEVWELVSGRDLESGYTSPDDADFPQDFKACPCTLALDVGRQMLEAVTFLWEIGIEHRDAQLSNMILSPRGELTLIDYDWMRDLRFDRGEEIPDDRSALQHQRIYVPKVPATAFQWLVRRWCPTPEDGTPAAGMEEVRTIVERLLGKMAQHRDSVTGKNSRAVSREEVELALAKFRAETVDVTFRCASCSSCEPAGVP